MRPNNAPDIIIDDDLADSVRRLAEYWHTTRVAALRRAATVTAAILAGKKSTRPAGILGAMKDGEK